MPDKNWATESTLSALSEVKKLAKDAEKSKQPPFMHAKRTPAQVRAAYLKDPAGVGQSLIDQTGSLEEALKVIDPTL